MERHNWYVEGGNRIEWHRHLTDVMPDMTTIDKILYHLAARISEGAPAVVYADVPNRMVEALAIALGNDEDVQEIAKELAIDLTDQIQLFLAGLQSYITPDLLVQTAPWSTTENERHDTAKELYNVVRNRFVSYMVSDIG